jgi:pimeloyl-ACP methyl ester carboxylesterase
MRRHACTALERRDRRWRVLAPIRGSDWHGRHAAARATPAAPVFLLGGTDVWEDLMAYAMSRRLLFASVGTAAIGLALTGRARKVAAEEGLGTFVLVHGGWHGGWCWRDVSRTLRAAGHAVWAPTLTGLGERAHLLTPDTDLDLHIQDIVNVLEYEDLSNVILVGHSYAGMVIAGVADRVPERLAHLVFLDAFVPTDGQSLFDLLRPERRDMYRQQTQVHGDGWRVPPPPPQALGVTETAQAAWLSARLTPQPLASFEQPVRLQHTAAERLTRTYIHCTEGPIAPSFAPFAATAQAEPGWRYAELPTGHDAMLITPQSLAGLLQDCAETSDSVQSRHTRRPQDHGPA